MNSAKQDEFLFSEGDEARLGLPLADDPLVRDIGKEWGLPVGQRVRVTFHPGESFRELSGRLEVAVAPELPLKRHRPLRLRVAGYEFVHTAIAGCVVVEAGRIWVRHVSLQWLRRAQPVSLGAADQFLRPMPLFGHREWVGHRTAYRGMFILETTVSFMIVLSWVAK